MKLLFNHVDFNILHLPLFLFNIRPILDRGNPKGACVHRDRKNWVPQSQKAAQHQSSSNMISAHSWQMKALTAKVQFLNSGTLHHAHLSWESNRKHFTVSSDRRCQEQLQPSHVSFVCHVPHIPALFTEFWYRKRNWKSISTCPLHC